MIYLVLLYKNVLSVGLISGNHAWVEQFIIDNKKHLPYQYHDSMYRSSMAQLKYQKGEIDTACHLIQHFHSPDSSINLQMKMLLVRIYYEQGENELLDALLSNTYSYVNQRKEFGKRKQRFQKAIQLTRKVMNIIPFEIDKKEKLYTDIKAAQIPSTFKKWLLLQIYKKSAI